MMLFEPIVAQDRRHVKYVEMSFVTRDAGI